MITQQAQKATTVRFIPPANDNQSPVGSRTSKAESASGSRGLEAYVRDLRRYPLLDAAAESEIDARTLRVLSVCRFETRTA